MDTLTLLQELLKHVKECDRFISVDVQCPHCETLINIDRHVLPGDVLEEEVAREMLKGGWRYDEWHARIVCFNCAVEFGL